jgi:polyhydroxybutyrate depolymerase
VRSRRALVALVALVALAACSSSRTAAPSTTTVASPSTTASASPPTTRSGPVCALAAGSSSPTVQERTFQLRAPGGPGPFPVIINLHGAGSNAGEQSVYSALPERGASRGFIVITPDGTGTPRVWNFLGDPDYAYLDAVLASLPAGCADPVRLYLAGISNGSAMSAFAVCHMQHHIAAIGLVAATVYPATCDPPPLPVLAFHGTADPLVPYGGGTVASSGLPVQGAEAAMAQWAAKDGCTATPTTTSLAPDVTQLDWKGCTSGLAVTLERIEGGGHTWPGSAIDVSRLGATTKSIDATNELLDFFEAH